MLLDGLRSLFLQALLCEDEWKSRVLIHAWNAEIERISKEIYKAEIRYNVDKVSVVAMVDERVHKDQNAREAQLGFLARDLADDMRRSGMVETRIERMGDGMWRYEMSAMVSHMEAVVGTEDN